MKNLVLYLIPEDAPLLENHHSAGTDAQLHRKLGYALYGLAVAPCRMEGNKHEFLEVTHTERAAGARKCSRFTPDMLRKTTRNYSMPTFAC